MSAVSGDCTCVELDQCDCQNSQNMLNKDTNGSPKQGKTFDPNIGLEPVENRSNLLVRGKHDKTRKVLGESQKPVKTQDKIMNIEVNGKLEDRKSPELKSQEVRFYVLK